MAGAGDDVTSPRNDAARDDATRDDATPAPPEKPRGWRTGEWPVFVRIDLSEAYANVRRRGRQLRRRRIISGVVAAIVLASLFTVVGYYYINAIPLPDGLSLPATTTVYYNDGETVLARLGSQNRTLVRIQTLPDHVGNAVVAAEDPAFWFDSATLLSRQYARAATGLDDRTPAGEARLLVMTWKLEDTYTKDQILEFYLNTVYFGRGAYGIEAAARAYFGKRAANLTVAESILLAGLIESPGDGRYDPTVDATGAAMRFATVAQRMVTLGALTEEEAANLRLPAVKPYDVTLFQSGLDRPTGLVVAHVLAELRAAPPFRDQPPHYLEEGGFRIVTTIDPRAQALLEHAAAGTAPGSLMDGQPGNLRAAAVVVEPGTGRVLAYYGGPDGTGADFAGTYIAEAGAAGYGAHPPGQTFTVYTLAAALQSGISVRSVWDSPRQKAFPSSGRAADNPVRNYYSASCQPRCSLAEAIQASLDVPFVSVTERIGPARVIDTAQALGIGAMWVPESAERERQRYDLAPGSGARLAPQPFGATVGVGEYPVTVLDQAAAMATLGAGGLRAQTHFVREVTKDSTIVYREDPGHTERVLDAEVAADVTWALRRSPHGVLPDGERTAAQIGVGRLRDTAVETAHAWTVGYTSELAMAVWIGNEEIEFPLKDKYGARVTGDTLPAQLYREVMAGVADALGLPEPSYPAPSFIGDEGAGDLDATEDAGGGGDAE
ncbi:MAG TPA: transglycosylase domain-containing protein [Micromonosporaceae bacterium]|nr:transglycosylase domain-containing protein [Micromonosporaceae bacterium]